MNSVKNEFGQRIPTPMQVLKDKLNAFERIVGSCKTVLNRQSAKTTVLFGWGSEVFKRKPITFDCIYLYKLEKIGASISFSFDFKCQQADAQTVRASFKNLEGSGVEYSQKYSIQEFKPLLKEFIDTYIKQDLSQLNKAQTKDFADHFVQHFNVNVSDDKTPSDLKSVKTLVVQEALALKVKMKENTQKMEKLKKGRYPLSESDRAVARQIVDETTVLAQRFNFLVTEGMKDLPAVARNHALSELKIDTSHLY